MTTSIAKLPPRTRRERMLLTLFLHARDWATVDVAGRKPVRVPDHVRLTRRAEESKLLAVFIADTFGVDLGADRVAVNSGVEPITTLAYLAAHTSHIGLVATVSTTFTEPYNLVRLLGSLDSLSRGRAGWNIVTSGWGEQYFGKSLPSHADRYRQAEEFVDLAKALWSSWADDALEFTPTGAASIRPGRITPVAHDGTFFRLHGAADKPPSPQGYPVLVQAGSSVDGIAFSARHAELVFTAQPFADDARTYYQAVKAASARPFGSGQLPRILPGVTLVLSGTEEEVEAKRIRGLRDVTLADARRSLRSTLAGIKLDDLGLDDRVPVERLPLPETVEGRRTFYKIYRRRLVEEGMTIRQLAHASNYHWQVHGTPEQAAAQMIERFETHSADGFNLMPTDEESYALIFDRLIPLLQAAGYASTDYASPILRENLHATAETP